jgi:hypothetical protein
MAIIERHIGCPDPPSTCFGPIGNYYTLFGTDLRFLAKYLVVSIILGLILFSFLLFLWKNKKININQYLIIIIPIIFTLLLFFALAYFFPILIDY